MEYRSKPNECGYYYKIFNLGPHEDPDYENESRAKFKVQILRKRKFRFPKFIEKNGFYVKSIDQISNVYLLAEKWAEERIETLSKKDKLLKEIELFNPVVEKIKNI